MPLELNRRSLITGLVSFVAVAPSIVRAASIMPVKVIKPIIQDAQLNLDRWPRPRIVTDLLVRMPVELWASQETWAKIDGVSTGIERPPSESCSSSADHSSVREDFPLRECEKVTKATSGDI